MTFMYEKSYACVFEFITCKWKELKRHDNFVPFKGLKGFNDHNNLHVIWYGDLRSRSKLTTEKTQLKLRRRNIKINYFS